MVEGWCFPNLNDDHKSILMGRYINPIGNLPMNYSTKHGKSRFNQALEGAIHPIVVAAFSRSFAGNHSRSRH
ncbi:predicted protein [Sclerotinia sclerotiorum 1980 UF-70]|uniref:Uncharacterized protein n=1 Tax=Sclerotinia sclerotiorum (strain ATCC 18683 / 1980 / Ss-1) TaxID=665079 RepID=A7F6Y5_SCLS1|nr:predicted protein [Sclerotinia sclerotiorum 1980 UF-70]EDN98506.1 predicted protein [Sclerotinia sclerotiorum 1980 UF-70]